MRFPGGNGGNNYHWNGELDGGGNYPPYAISQGWTNNTWKVDFEEFIQLLNDLGDGAQPTTKKTDKQSLIV